MTPSHCFCGTQTSYANCCQPLHQHKALAASAETLMRSRYSAFCTGNTDYLVATLHPNFRQANELQLLRESMNPDQWLGLKIISSDKNTVEFVAFYKDTEVRQIHEKSNFLYEEGRWYYTTGKHLPDIKLNRNDICYCGSFVKYKKCCGR